MRQAGLPAASSADAEGHYCEMSRQETRRPCSHASRTQFPGWQKQQAVKAALHVRTIPRQCQNRASCMLAEHQHCSSALMPACNSRASSHAKLQQHAKQQDNSCHDAVPDQLFVCNGVMLAHRLAAGKPIIANTALCQRSWGQAATPCTVAVSKSRQQCTLYPEGLETCDFVPTCRLTW